MKYQIQIGLVAALVLTATVAFSASSSFVKKEPAASGSFTYFYKYSCANRAEGTITVVSKTDDEARKLAEVKARRVCEE